MFTHKKIHLCIIFMCASMYGIVLMYVYMDVSMYVGIYYIHVCYMYVVYVSILVK